MILTFAELIISKMDSDELHLAGHQHCCGSGGSPDFMPYSCPAFREVAVTTFRKSHEKKANSWTTEKPITWLGRGQVAFVDCLVSPLE